MLIPGSLDPFCCQSWYSRAVWITGRHGFDCDFG